MHEVVFGIAGSAGLLVFTVLLELRVEGVLDTTWVLPFGFLWVTLAVYFVWIAQFFHARPRHWAVATIAIGVVLVAQAVGVPLVLERTRCESDADGCNDRRMLLARIILIPLAVVEFLGLAYLVRNYVWTMQREKEENDKYMRGLTASVQDEWGAEDPMNDMSDQEAIDAAMVALDRETQLARERQSEDGDFVYD